MNPTGAPLGFGDGPPIDVPLRFFLTAPLFGVAAGALVASTPELLTTRWSPGAMAVTHLLGVGFVLMSVVGALFQLLPVVAGARVAGGRRVAGVCHVALVAGAAGLAWGLGRPAPGVVPAAGALLAGAIATLAAAAAPALRRAQASTDTARDLRFGLAGLGVAAALGWALTAVLGGLLSWPLLPLLRAHVAWAWLGGVGMVLAGTSWVVVPMFQITPPYPPVLTRRWSAAALLALVGWSVAAWLGPEAMVVALSLLALCAATFAAATLRVQRKTRRAVPDQAWWGFACAMASILAGAVALAPASRGGAAWEVVVGVLILYGGFVGVIQSMLSKIVPFLIWQDLTGAGIRSPSMKQLMPEAWVRRQLLAHGASVLTLLAAVASASVALGRVAGVVVAASFALLALQLARSTYRWRAARASPTS